MITRAVPGRPNTPKPRKKWRIVALGFAGTLLLALSIALWIAQTRYEAVFRAPRIQHEAFATGNTALKIVVRPPLAQRRIATLLLPQRNLPDWLLNMTMPQETAILFDPDLDESTLKLRMFVNYARLGPVLRDALNQSGITRSVGGIQWTTPEMVEKQPGVLLLEGSAPISQPTVQGIQAQWVDAQDFPPPRIDGTHFFEVALENRNGKGCATLVALMELNGPMHPLLQSFLSPKSLFVVATLHAYANFTDADTLAVVIVVEGNPSASADPAKQIKYFLDKAIDWERENLRQKYGAELEGESVIEGTNVRGQYTIKNIDALLVRLQATG